MTPPLVTYAEVLGRELCTKILARFDGDARKQPGRALGAGHPKFSTDLGITRLVGWEDLVRPIDAAVIASAHRYRDEHPTFARAVREIRHTGYQIQRYRPGGVDRFDWHADVIDAATAHRVLALVLYLDTVAEGGETEFAVQALAVKPVAGTALWFPPTFEYLHRGRPPVSAAKHVLTTFLVER